MKQRSPENSDSTLLDNGLTRREFLKEGAEVTAAIPAAKLDRLRRLLAELPTPTEPTPEDDNQSQEQLSSYFPPEIRRWAADISRWSKVYSIEPDIIAILMLNESHGDPDLIRNNEDYGLFQVNESNFEEGDDKLDPDTNASRALPLFLYEYNGSHRDIKAAFGGYTGGTYARLWLTESNQYTREDYVQHLIQSYYQYVPGLTAEQQRQKAETLANATEYYAQAAENLYYNLHPQNN